MTDVTDRIEKVTLRRFRRYSEYQGSGVEWLGEIPAHWDLTRTKFAATLRSGHTPSRQNPEYWKDCTIPWFGLADVWQIRDGQVEYVKETAEKISEIGLANSAARLLPKSTVILSRTASVGFSAILGVDMATTQDFVNWVCGPSLQPEYLLYVFRAMGPEFRRFTMGSTHQTIYMPDVGRFSTPVPPVPEQDQIVAFIQEETTAIEGLVARKERLIELLQEKRTALITRAVTRGLDPDVPMKDSGVEWLGEIPAHWDVKPFKALLVRNDSGVWGEDSASEGTIVLRSTEQSINGEWSIDTPAIRMLTAREAAQAQLEIGDLVVTKSSGSHLHIGKTSIVDESIAELRCGFSNFMQRLRVDCQHEARFFWYLMNAPVAREQLVFLSSTTTGLGNLNASIMGAIRVAAAPLIEQRAIAAFLDREAAKIDMLIARVQGAVDLLKEFRTALISAAVTGKIDVREEAA